MATLTEKIPSPFILPGNVHLRMLALLNNFSLAISLASKKFFCEAATGAPRRGARTV